MSQDSRRPEGRQFSPQSIAAAPTDAHQQNVRSFFP